MTYICETRCGCEQWRTVYFIKTTNATAGFSFLNRRGRRTKQAFQRLTLQNWLLLSLSSGSAALWLAHDLAGKGQLAPHPGSHSHDWCPTKEAGCREAGWATLHSQSWTLCCSTTGWSCALRVSSDPPLVTRTQRPINVFSSPVLQEVHPSLWPPSKNEFSFIPSLPITVCSQDKA